jgi:hypothetical protein
MRQFDFDDLEPRWQRPGSLPLKSPRAGATPPLRKQGFTKSPGRLQQRKGVDMADKSPRKVASKKSGKTLKEKRKDKKEKQQVRKGLAI